LANEVLVEVNQLGFRRGESHKEVERVEGIEPSTKAWEAFVLPLNYTRSERLTLYQKSALMRSFYS
jgi:hypothetical protein